MEFGPRALGARSIIADARNTSMQKNLNLKIKFRESFRPFAPAILEEYFDEYFEKNMKSEYMLLIAEVNESKRIKSETSMSGLEKVNAIRSSIPAVTHIDYTARVQTLHKSSRNKFRSLLEAFHKKTGCPVLINTSFNVRGEPIVNNPLEAFQCFMGTNLDVLAIGNFYLDKDQQMSNYDSNYKEKFTLD
jgi:carbamoyltransferase